MIRPSARWCAFIALSIMLPVVPAKGADPASTARDAAGSVLQQFGSADGIRQNVSLPLTSDDTQLSTIDRSDSASVQLGNPSSDAFLSVTIQPVATGDLMPVTVSQDLNFDGVYDYTYRVPFQVSGICANGIMSCDAGTWDNCRSYTWDVGAAARVTLQTVPMNQLAGCYCVNQDCGTSSNTQAMLKDIGGAVVARVQAVKGGYTISRVQINESTILYYGQDSGNSPTGTVNQASYYGNPAAIAADMNTEIADQTGDPDSYYSMLTTSYAARDTGTGLQSCTASRTVPLNDVSLDDIVVPVGGTGAVQTCGPDCIRIVLGRQGNNYWSGYCSIFEENYTVYVNNPDLIETATLMRATWDDYIQVWIDDAKVYNGPNNNFPPETSGACELSTSWSMPLDIDVTGYFQRTGEVDTKIRVSVAGYGEGYAFVEVQVNNLCEILDDVITDNCQAFEEDSNCRLKEESIDGVLTWQDFNPTGNYPSPSTMTVSSGSACSKDITRDWWRKERTYNCSGNTFDLSDAARRVDTITGSLEGNSMDQTTFDYTDARKDMDSGTWTTDDQVLEVNEIDLPPDCEFICKTRKPVQDTQASLTGVSTDYQNTPTRYDTFYHVCGPDNICPAGSGEEVVNDCQCLNEFAEAASIMMVLDEAGRDMLCTGGGTTATGDCLGEIKIFDGKRSECLQNGWYTTFFDCCDASVDSFLFFKEHCPDASLETVQAKQADRAHYIGTYCKKDIFLIGCIQEAEVYCLFNSQMGRIIQEQGRDQLQEFAPDGDWGSVGAPNCEGLTPEEFQMLDFSKIDLSEVFGDISPLPAAQMQNNVQGAISDFQNKVR